MKIVSGNLVSLALRGNFDIILHCANCFNTMGKGIALEIKHVFTEAYAADCRTVKGDYGKLGDCSYARVEVINNKSLIVINGYMQYNYGKGLHLDYQAVQKVLVSINTYFKGARIGLPKIGCYNAGGDWTIVEKLISDTLVDLDVTVVVLEK